MLRRTLLAAALPAPIPLAINGIVREARLMEEDAQFARFSADLTVAFANRGTQRLLVLKRIPLSWPPSLLITPEPDGYGPAYVDRYAGQSVNRELYRTERERLLTSRGDPPEELIAVIAPGEAWQEQGRVGFGIGKPRAWRLVQQHPATWMHLGFDLWPLNLDWGRRPLAAELRKRWRRHGVLVVESMRSKPIRLDLTAAVSRSAPR